MLTLAFAVVSLHASAGVVITAEGKSVSGELTMPEPGRITVTPEEGEPSTHGLIDLDRVLLRPDLSPGVADLLLIDNDGPHGATTKTAKIKLKAGLHRVTLAYWQAKFDATLKLEVEGPDIPRREVTGSMLFNVKNETDPPLSEGYDAKGLRLPENPEAPRPRIRYRMFKGAEDAPWETIGVFDHLEQQSGGTTDRCSTRVSNRAHHYGVVFQGYFKAKADGEYTFHLTSDDGAVMWLGKNPAFMATLSAGATPPEARPWIIHLTGNGQVRGKITAWDDQSITLEAPHDDDVLKLTIPRTHIRRLVSSNALPDEAIRTELAAELDHAIIRRDNNELSAVSGRSLGLDGEVLLFEYKGEPRKIKLDRLNALVLANDAPDASAKRGFSQRLDLLSGHILPGTWSGLSDGKVQYQTAWGQDVSVRAESVGRVRMVGGRVIELADSEPDDARHIPYFDRAIPHSRNQSITGGTLAHINGLRFQKGFAVHGRTLLHFNLGGEFARFQTTAGLQQNAGARGDVHLRVVGDGKTLYESKNYTAENQPAALDLDVTGVKQLTLETDFAGGDDVGDFVVWAEPKLIRVRGSDPQ